MRAGLGASASLSFSRMSFMSCVFSLPCLPLQARGRLWADPDAHCLIQAVTLSGSSLAPQKRPLIGPVRATPRFCHSFVRSPTALSRKHCPLISLWTLESQRPGPPASPDSHGVGKARPTTDISPCCRGSPFENTFPDKTKVLLPTLHSEMRVHPT